MLPLNWFDGHLDLAYLALTGRDLTCPNPANAGGAHQPGAVSFPALTNANVHRVISTIFVARADAEHNGPFAYNTPEEAHQAGLLQLKLHEDWEKSGHVKVENQKSNAPLQLTIAIEGAACLRTPDDLPHFHNAGVRMLSLTWAEGSPYAGGDRTGTDITPLGRELIQRIDALGIVHDVSHLSERAFWTLLELAKGPIVASHSNCQALLPGAKTPERHLNDNQIKALTQRGGIIGINLFARFLIPPDQLNHRRATIADVIAHIQHIENLTNSRNHLALGTDADGGFSTHYLPENLDSFHHLPRLAEALSKEGWTDEQIQTFANRWQSLPALA